MRLEIHKSTRDENGSWDGTLAVMLTDGDSILESEAAYPSTLTETIQWFVKQHGFLQVVDERDADTTLTHLVAQLRVYHDHDYDIDENFELESDKEAARRLGLVCAFLEVATSVDAYGEPQFDLADSCGGFINTPTVIDHIQETLELPAGLSWDDVSIYTEGSEL